MLNMKDSDKHNTIRWPNIRLHLENAATKRLMKTIHGDQLGQTSGYNGVVITDTKQQIFSDT